MKVAVGSFSAKNDPDSLQFFQILHSPFQISDTADTMGRDDILSFACTGSLLGNIGREDLTDETEPKRQRTLYRLGGGGGSSSFHFSGVAPRFGIGKSFSYRGTSAASSFARSYAQSASPSSLLASASLKLAGAGGGAGQLDLGSSTFSSADGSISSWKSFRPSLQQVEAMVMEDLYKYDNDPEYRALVDGISEDVEAVEAVEATTLTDRSSDVPAGMDVDDILGGYGTKTGPPADENGGEEGEGVGMGVDVPSDDSDHGSDQPAEDQDDKTNDEEVQFGGGGGGDGGEEEDGQAEGMIADEHSDGAGTAHQPDDDDGEEVPSDREDGEEDRPDDMDVDESSGGNGTKDDGEDTDDLMDADNEGSDDQPSGNQGAETNDGGLLQPDGGNIGGEENGQNPGGMEVDEPSDDVPPPVHSVEMNSYVKLQMQPPDVPIPTEQERAVLLTRAQSAQQAVRHVAETMIEYKERGESHMEQIQINLDPDFFDDVPTADLAKAGFLNGDVSCYSLEFLDRAAKRNPVPRGGVVPVMQIEIEEEEEEYDYGDEDEEYDDDEEDEDTIERFGNMKRGNYYIFQYIRTSIEENGKAIVALLKQLGQG